MSVGAVPQTRAGRQELIARNESTSNILRCVLPNPQSPATGGIQQVLTLAALLMLCFGFAWLG